MKNDTAHATATQADYESHDAAPDSTDEILERFAQSIRARYDREAQQPEITSADDAVANTMGRLVAAIERDRAAARVSARSCDKDEAFGQPTIVDGMNDNHEFPLEGWKTLPVADRHAHTLSEAERSIYAAATVLEVLHGELVVIHQACSIDTPNTFSQRVRGGLFCAMQQLLHVAEMGLASVRESHNGDSP